jgi:hypothetical protein
MDFCGLNSRLVLDHRVSHQHWDDTSLFPNGRRAGGDSFVRHGVAGSDPDLGGACLSIVTWGYGHHAWPEHFETCAATETRREVEADLGGGLRGHCSGFAIRF